MVQPGLFILLVGRRVARFSPFPVLLKLAGVTPEGPVSPVGPSTLNCPSFFHSYVLPLVGLTPRLISKVERKGLFKGLVLTEVRQMWADPEPYHILVVFFFLIVVYLTYISFTCTK